jgi:hypothetical protein
MSEEWYSPSHKLPERIPRPGEGIWQVRHNHALWSCELRDHSPWGVEAQILRDNELVIGRRFDTRELAIQWAELERCDIEHHQRGSQ